MKAITVLQPYASLIACGAKKIETRSWATKYRGPIAIHAGKRLPIIDNDVIEDTLYEFEMPLGKVIAIADLVDCLRVTGRASLKIGDEKYAVAILENGKRIVDNEFLFGDYEIGRYAWVLANVRRIEPVPTRGMQRIWNWEGEETC